MKLSDLKVGEEYWVWTDDVKVALKVVEVVPHEVSMLDDKKNWKYDDVFIGDGVSFCRVLTRI